MIVDGLHAELVLSLDPCGPLSAFNRAGVLAAADIHVASALSRLGGERDELVALAVALAVRAPRVGHVLADLGTVRQTVTTIDDVETDLAALPWPPLEDWLERVSRSPLVATAGGVPDDRPLRLAGTCLYLDKYWRDERDVAADIIARSGGPPLPLDERSLAEGLARLYGDDPSNRQAHAAVTTLRRRFSVIAGGPGTGKTTTVARVLALMLMQARAIGGPTPSVALAAPTGKAAARMAEAVHEEARRLEVDEGLRAWLLGLDASTVHRLLGRRPGSATHFRHDRNSQLPHDVVVVDETSMMSLPLMARLVDAVRRDARLVLIGDQEQLASVEAGAVLGDIVGPAARLPAAALGTAGRAAGPSGGPIGKCITVLQSNYRFRGPLAELAGAVRSGDDDAVMAALSREPPVPDRAGEARWLPVDVATADAVSLEPVRSAVAVAGTALAEAASEGDGPAALDALGRVRLLCAHRNGPAGAATWNERVEQWLAEGPAVAPTEGAWYIGRPVIVTQNDYGLGLFNGDTGVVIEDGGLRVAFRRGAGVMTVSPSRLASVDTAFAMTVHRAQGSEFDDVVVLLPTASSRVLTRELLYTAVTRARRSLLLVGTEESVRAAVNRPIARASGLTARLWDEPA